MRFSGHTRSLHLLRGVNDESKSPPPDLVSATPSPDASRASKKTARLNDKSTSRDPETYDITKSGRQQRLQSETQAPISPWISPKASVKVQDQGVPPGQHVWPNGLPPTGPKARRSAISPPASRRSLDGSQHVRRTSEQGMNEPYARQSFHASIQLVRRDSLAAEAESVVENVRPDHANASNDTSYLASGRPDVVLSGGGTASYDSEPKAPTMVAPPPDFSETWKAVLAKTRFDNATLQSRSGSPPLNSDLQDIFATKQATLRLATQLSPPLARASGSHHDETGSVISDLTMSSSAPVSGRSSMTSGKKTKTCHKCKKAAQPVSPLFKCNECPRRYHSHCAVPKISSSVQANDGLEWTCKHCIKKSREKKKDCVPSSLPPRPVKSLSPALESEYSLPLPFSIAEPPASDISGMLGLLHNATTLTTRNEESSVEGATFQHREAASRTERQEAENAKNGEPLPYFNDSSTAMIITAPDGTGNIATPKLPSQLDRVPKKYVTCFWWTTKTGCKYSEVDCQFAHRQTGLVSEKPSYKNSVCYYWRTKGVCKFSDEDCKFAHWDTGVQAQAPPPPAARFSTGVGYDNDIGAGQSDRPQETNEFRLGRALERHTTTENVVVEQSDTSHESMPMNQYSTFTSPTELQPVHPSSPRCPTVPGGGSKATAIDRHSTQYVPPSSIPESPWGRLSPVLEPANSNSNSSHQAYDVRSDPRLARCPSSTQESDLRVGDTNGVASGNLVPGITASIPPTNPSVNHKTNSGPAPPPLTTKCKLCEKMVLGNAALCFTCKKTMPPVEQDMNKSSPAVPETPDLITGDNTFAHHQPALIHRESNIAWIPTANAVSPSKRPASMISPSGEGSMFIKKKPRLVRPLERQKTSGETSGEISHPLLIPQMAKNNMENNFTLTPTSTALKASQVEARRVEACRPITLQELTENERLRKENVTLKTTCDEGRMALDEAEKLRKEEKARADKLSEELRTSRIRDRQIRVSGNNESRQAIPELTQRTTDDVVTMANALPRAKRLKHASKPEVRATSTQGPLTSPKKWSEYDEKKLVQRLVARGVEFDSEDDSSDVEVPLSKPHRLPTDPLWRGASSSRNLFEIAPHYQQENLFFDTEAKKKEIAARPRKKQMFKRILPLSNHECGSAGMHRELDRCLSPRFVRVRVPDNLETDPQQRFEDQLGGDSTERHTEVEMTFEEFIGAPENALLCKTTMTDQLAYRDGTLDSRGKLARVTDEDKYEVGTKSG